MLHCVPFLASGLAERIGTVAELICKLAVHSDLQKVEESSATAIRLDKVYIDSGACYGIEWSFRGLTLCPQQIFGDCMYLDESEIVRFSPGEGLVGKVYLTQDNLLLHSVRDANADFLRKRSALDDAIESIAFVWHDCRVFEFGFRFRMGKIPDSVAPQSQWLLPKPLTNQQQVPNFTPAAHHKAFLSPDYPHPDMRSEQQMPGFLPPTDRVFFKMDEVRRHTSKDDAWIVVHNNVYNITNFIKHHPGWEVGSQSSTIVAILHALGKDCTSLFDAIHPDYAIRQLADYRAGELHPRQSEAKF